MERANVAFVFAKGIVAGHDREGGLGAGGLIPQRFAVFNGRTHTEPLTTDTDGFAAPNLFLRVDVGQNPENALVVVCSRTTIVTITAIVVGFKFGTFAFTRIAGHFG